MISWIKLDTSIHTKPEVIQMASMLNLSEFDIVGRLTYLWAWADTHSINGNALGVTETFIDRYLGVSGFAIAMQKVGWLININNTLSIPNFDRHNGKTAKERALTSKRVDAHRNRKGQICNDASVTTALTEKRREDISDTHTHNEKYPNSLEEVFSIGSISGISKDFCNWFLSHYESNGWIDGGTHMPVYNWKSKLKKLWIEKENNDNKGKTRNGHYITKPPGQRTPTIEEIIDVPTVSYGKNGQKL